MSNTKTSYEVAGFLQQADWGNAPGETLTLTVPLPTVGGKKQALSPFVGITLVWADYGYEDRIEINAAPQADWQVTPLVPADQNYNTIGPYIEFVPYG